MLSRETPADGRTPHCDGAAGLPGVKQSVPLPRGLVKPSHRFTQNHSKGTLLPCVIVCLYTSVVWRVPHLGGRQHGREVT